MKEQHKITLVCDQCKKDEITAVIPPRLAKTGVELVEMYAELGGWKIDDQHKRTCPMCQDGEWQLVPDTP